MLKKTFRGGVCLSEHKELTVDRKIKSVPPPKEAILPLTQHTGTPNKSVVVVGDAVKIGQLIGEAKAFISAPLHSPVSGRVKAVGDFFNPIYGKGPSIVIENDGKDESIDFEKKKDPERLSRKDLLEIIKNAGLVGLGGAAFPTHVKLDIPKEKRIDYLIINGAECEPYLTSDHRLMTEKTDGILKGVCLAAKILDVKNIFIAIEDNKLSAIFAMERAAHQINKKFPDRKIEVVSLKTKYPQGGEKQLVRVILNREVPPRKLPLDVGSVVQNVGTCFSIYEAVYEGRPLIERCITFTGECLREPGNFIVRIGTRVRDVVEFCGGFREEPFKIIVGGPMMGVSQYSLDIPIIKGVTGVLFLSRRDSQVYEESQCIRCARCVDTCPVNLLPTDIMRMVKFSRWHYMNELNPTDCIECGCCAYICPSRIPLVQYIKLAKIKRLNSEK